MTHLPSVLNLLTQTSHMALPNVKEAEKYNPLILADKSHLNHDYLSLLSSFIPLLPDLGSFYLHQALGDWFQTSHS